MSNRTGRYQIYVMSSGGGAAAADHPLDRRRRRAALVAGREEDRLPGAGRRQLRDLRRRSERRRPAPADERRVRQHRPGVVAGRQEDRVPQQAQRRRQRLRDERRRLRPEEASPSKRRGSEDVRSPRPRARPRRPAEAPGPSPAGQPREQQVAGPERACCAPHAATSSAQRCTSSRSVDAAALLPVDARHEPRSRAARPA